MKNSKIRLLTIICLLSSFACVLSYFDAFISRLIIPYAPVKMGLSNIVILYSIYKLDFKSSIIISFVKSFLVSFIFGSLTTFIIGGSASLLSFLIMSALHKVAKEKTSIIGVSVLGGIIHILTQLVITSLIYKLYDIVFYYGWILLITSFITSILVGFLCQKILRIKKEGLE